MINGQKVWTTQAQYADYIFLLARTDPDAPKHAGISYLLVPMQQPGIEVRPIEQVDGSAEFNEVFFTDARCPTENVVGGVNNGWKVAMTTLGFERGTSATTGHRRFAREFDAIVGEARRRGRDARPAGPPAPGPGVVEDQDHGDQRLPHPHRRPQRDPPRRRARARATRCSGPSTTSETMDLAMDILGMRGPDPDGRPRRRRTVRRRAPGTAGLPGQTTCRPPSSSRGPRPSGAGTAEIQRNIVGERVLGLPKEPKPA